MWVCDLCGNSHDSENAANHCCFYTIEITSITNREVIVKRRMKADTQLKVHLIYQLHMKMRGEEIILLIEDNEEDMLELSDIISAPSWFEDDIRDKEEYELLTRLGELKYKFDKMIGEFEMDVVLPDGKTGKIPIITN